MKASKKKALAKAGWRVSSTADFLNLSPQEAELVGMRSALAAALRMRRQARKLTQAQLAKSIRSSQSRVAKMEAADSSVSIDLLMQSLLATGATRKDLAKIIAPRKKIAKAA